MVIELRTAPVITEPADKPPCAICRRQFSKYTCPACNIPYCSLACFQSETHTQCSEAFYKREIHTDIGTHPSAGHEERAKMMELLKRFEHGEGLGEDGNSDDDEEGDEYKALAERLGGIDLDTANPEDIWKALSESQRSSFLKALENPSSELAQQLLSSERLHNARVRPWWEDSGDEITASRPPIIPVLPSMLRLPPQVTPPLLLYNTVALLLAYTYTIRAFAARTVDELLKDDTDGQEAGRIVSQLVPFLVEHDSKTRLSSLSDALTDVSSRFVKDELTPALLTVLLQDVSLLVQPQTVTLVTSTSMDASSTLSLDSHPNWRLFCALSDLSRLYSRPRFKGVPLKDQGNRKTASIAPAQVVRKLTFYVANVAMCLPIELAMALSAEIKARATRIELEGQESSVSTMPEDGAESSVPIPPANKPLIEELV